MHIKIICIYCICDDFLSALGVCDDEQCRMTSAEILTVAIVSALFFNGNFARARLILKHDGYISNMLSEGRLNRRLHEIDISVWQSIFQAISEVFCKKNTSLEYLVDSMPVEVCINVRSYRCRLLNGFKIHMITTDDGKPVEFIITPASTADITAFKVMEINLPQGASIYGDKAYTEYSFEDDLQEFEGIRLIADRKKNATRQHPGCVQYLQTILRKRIENPTCALSASQMKLRWFSDF